MLGLSDEPDNIRHNKRRLKENKQRKKKQKRKEKKKGAGVVAYDG